jgi:hypothetical protein
VASDDHEMWKPGYDGPEPERATAQPWADDVVEEPSGLAGPSDPDRPSRRSLLTAAVGAAAAVVVGGVAVRSRAASSISASVTAIDRTSASARAARVLDPLQGTGATFAGSRRERLPADAEERWRRSEAGREPVWAHAAGAGLVIVAAPDGPTTTRITAVDADSGRGRWSTAIAAAIDTVRFVGAARGSIVLETRSELGVAAVGLDDDDGANVWRIEADVRPEPVRAFEVLHGTRFVARRPVDDRDPTVVFDPGVGFEAITMRGRVLSDDHLGHWYALDGDRIVEYDLAGDEASSVVIGSTAGLDAAVAGAVKRLPLVAVGGELRTASERTDTPVADVVRLANEGPPVPGVVDALLPMVASAMVIGGAGSIVGAELDGADLRTVWDRRGVLFSLHPTRRGVVLLVGSRGGAAQEIIDGRTGMTIAAVSVTPGFGERLRFAGNGFVLRRFSESGARLAALDLDGEEMWALPDATPATIGDGYVVRVEPRDAGRGAGHDVVAYGAAS